MSRASGGRMDPDDAIRSTDDDAAASRLSAVSLGYLDDPFTALLYRAPRLGQGEASSSRKSPLINVGTHHRTKAIDLLVDRFLEEAGASSQIVSLGAGSDSRFWRIKSSGRSIARYVEIDFPHLTSMKAQRISRSPKLTALLDTAQKDSPRSINSPAAMGPPGALPSKSYTISKGGTQLESASFVSLPLDLRDTPSDSLTAHLLPLLDPQKPTLFLAECVFCYMQPSLSREITDWFGGTFDRVAGVVYEMCGLDDTFGAVMKRNLAARHLSIPGSEPFPNVASQAARFTDDRLGSSGFERSSAKSLWQIRQEVIDPRELVRISKLEFLDEIEELRLVLSHYCVASGSKGLALALL